MSQHPNPYGGPPGPPPGGPPHGLPQAPPDTKASSRRRVLMGIVGTVLGLPSFPCVAMALYDLFFGLGDNVSGMIGLLVIFGFTAFLSAILLVKAFRGAAEEAKASEFSVTREWERRILEVARTHQGELSVAQLAVDTNLTIEESRLALDTMIERGAANLEVSEYGDTFYQFPTFVPKDRPPGSSDLDDFDRRLSDARESVAFDFEEAQQPHHHKK